MGITLNRKNLWIATHNKNKISEFQNLLSDLPFDLKFLDSLSSPYNAPEETGSTFIENATIKLKSFQKHFPNKWVLVEDSGFEVECLGGKPGIYSARYHKEKPLKERLEHLLKDVQQTGSSNYNVQMTSVTMLATPDGKVLESVGVVKGTLAQEIRGEQGFVYDYVFIPLGENQTMAEMGYLYKNKHSHRSRSVEGLKKKIKEIL